MLFVFGLHLFVADGATVAYGADVETRLRLLAKRLAGRSETVLKRLTRFGSLRKIARKYLRLLQRASVPTGR